ncbi:transmembrane protein [Pseudozyma hubeiensis SY62]|uniref:Store-operated calcium entry-associated regulatory factor n=1 Tax=Pseudozyma hubeiensis (strain SY62) TaxID=1305764 RepID=R9P7W4_PSEHS|nr:transmembrane protein [Pseudozyma hubeiensis SY62]GAC94195.1 transmembrane protein [Pseudozyma hubeiensis SY62]
MRRSSTHLLLLVCALLAVTTAPAYSWQPNAAYYGAGRRVALSSLRTLTFYSGKHTAFRRTSPLPHLTCIGSPCRRFQPDVVQCTAMGDGQWKCSADLPVTIRMGRVEVSCEGYDYAEDPQQPSFFNPDPYGGYDGNFAAGPSSHFGGRRRGWDDSDRGSSSAFRESTGFGGTRNR